MLHLASIHTTLIGLALILLLAGFFLTRMMKGKIECQLPKNGCGSGEEIAGKLTLTTKRTLQLKRLYVSLIGYQLIEDERR